MTISFSGLASGLDTTSWIESLVALKRAKVTTLSAQREEVLNAKDTLSSIKSFFNNFRTTVQKITNSRLNPITMNLFAQNIATSADLNVLTAVATHEAEEATYRVKVDKLATKTNATSKYKKTVTTTVTKTATESSYLKHIGVEAGNIGVTVGGIKYTLAITEDDTIDSFISKLDGIGVTASYNKNTGVFSMNISEDDIDDDIDNNGVNNTKIKEKLHLEGVNEGYKTLGNLTFETVVTDGANAKGNTTLRELGVGNGTVIVEANDKTYTINTDTTLDGFVTTLNGYNITAAYDEATGILTFEDARIVNEGGTDIINALGLSNPDVFTQSQSTDKLTFEKLTIATSATLLKDIGGGTAITDGDKVIVTNSNNEITTITVGQTTSIGDLLGAITNAGLYAAIDKDGIIEISGGKIDETSTFNLIAALGLESEPYTAMTSGNPLTETITEYEIVTLQTRLVEDLGVTKGYLEVTDADGNKFYEKIYSGQTIADFMADLGNLGIYTSLDEESGILSITGGSFRTLDNLSNEVGSLVANGTIVEPDTNYRRGTNLLECLYGSDVIATDHIEVASTYSRTRALRTQEVQYATLDSTLSIIGLTTEGTAIFETRGSEVTINVTKTMSIQDLRDKLAENGIATEWDEYNSKLTLKDATLVGGTSNLDDVLGLTPEISGMYATTNTLYTTTTDIVNATIATQFKELGVTGNQSVVLNKADGNTYTFTVTGDTALLAFMNEINAQGVTVSLKEGVLKIDGGYITNTAIENALGLERSVYGESTVLGNKMTHTIITTATGDTTLGQIVTALGTTTSVSSGYTLLFNSQSLSVSATTTIDDLVMQIHEKGGTTVIDNTGRLCINGGTLSGTVATALGFNSVALTMSVAATGETLQTIVTVNADSTTKLSSLGLGASTITIHGIDGTTVGTVTTAANMTIGDVLTALAGYGISGTIVDGVIKLSSDVDHYATGGVLASMGVGTANVTYTTTAGVTNTSTAVVSSTYTITANSDTTLSSLGLGASTITVKGVDGVTVGTVTTDADMTIGDVLTALAGYGISGTIVDGVIKLSSDVDHYATGGVLTSMGVGTANVTYTTTAGSDKTSTAAVTYETVTYTTSFPTLTQTVVTTGTVVVTEPVIGSVTVTVSDTFTVTDAVTSTDYITIEHSYTCTEPVTSSSVVTVETTFEVIEETTASVQKTVEFSTVLVHNVQQTLTISTTSTITVTEYLTGTNYAVATSDTKLSDVIGYNSSMLLYKDFYNKMGDFVAQIPITGISGDSTLQEVASAIGGTFENGVIKRDLEYNSTSGGYAVITGTLATALGIGVDENTVGNDTTTSMYSTNQVIASITNSGTGGTPSAGEANFYTTIMSTTSTMEQLVMCDDAVNVANNLSPIVVTHLSTGATASIALSSTTTLQDIINGLSPYCNSATVSNGILNISIKEGYSISFHPYVSYILNLNNNTEDNEGKRVEISNTDSYVLQVPIPELIGTQEARKTVVVTDTVTVDQSVTSTITWTDTITVTEVTGTNFVTKTAFVTMTLETTTTNVVTHTTKTTHAIEKTTTQPRTITVTSTHTLESTSTKDVTITVNSTGTIETTTVSVSSTTTTANMKDSTLLSQIGASGSFTVYRKNQDGTYSSETLTTSNNMTVGDLVDMLESCGVGAYIKDGKFYINGTKDAYIYSMDTTLSSKLKLNGSFYSTTSHTATGNTNSNEQNYSTTNTLTTDDTFGRHGLTANGTITVVSDGTEYVVTVKTSSTIDDILTTLAGHGIVGYVDGGKISLQGDDEAYIKAISSNLNTVLKLGTTNYSTTSHTATGNTNSNQQKETIHAVATGATALKDLRNPSGSATTNYSLVLSTTSDAGNELVTLTFSATSTVNDVIDALVAKGLNATIDTTGRFAVNSNTLTDFDISGGLGTFIMGGTYTKVYDEGTVSSISTNLIQKTTVDMDDSTTLKQIGITSGNVVLYKDGTKHTIAVLETQTVGDFRNQLAEYGINSSIVEGKLQLIADGVVYLETPATGGSNLVTKMGLGQTDWDKGGYSQKSDKLEDTTTVLHIATMDTQIKNLTNASKNSLGITNGQIYVYDHGARSIINIDINDTLQDLANKLEPFGITVGISSGGVVYFDGDKQSYLTTDGLASGVASNILTKIGLSAWEESFDSTSETLDYIVDGASKDIGSTKMTDLQDADGNSLGITEGTYYVYQNGVRSTETITSDTTVNDFRATMAGYGLITDFNEDGSLSVGAYNNTYLATAATAGMNTNAVSVLFEEWDFVNIYNSNGLEIPTDVTVAISETTKLADINEGTYQAGFITVVKDGVKTDIELTANDTVGDLIDELALYGFESIINANGELIIKNTGNSLLDQYDGGSNALELLGIGKDSWVNTNNYASDTVSELKETIATRDTLLSELDCFVNDPDVKLEGEYYIYKDGVKYTAMISSEETLGSFMDTLASFGIQTSLVFDNDNDDANGIGTTLSIIGNGNSYVARSTSTTNASDVVNLFAGGLTSTYLYSGEQRIDVTSTVAATEDTLLSKFDSPTLKAQGDLSVTVDGVTNIIQISSGETFGTFMAKLEALGLDTTLSSEGELVIQSGYKELSINTLGTAGESKILDTLDIEFVNDMGGYVASNAKVDDVQVLVEDKILSVANYADENTTLDLLSITGGTLTIYRDGQKATITLDPTQKFEKLKEDIKDRFSDVVLEMGADGYMRIYSTTGAQVDVGSTTDTSNFSAITGVQRDENGEVRSARELYCANSASKITTSGIFRKADVTEGTFKIGDAKFTIDDSTTISDIVSQINASQEANATAYWDSVDAKLVIQSRTTGAALINIEAGTSNFTDVMGLTQNSEWNCVSLELATSSSDTKLSDLGITTGTFSFEIKKDGNIENEVITINSDTTLKDLVQSINDTGVVDATWDKISKKIIFDCEGDCSINFVSGTSNVVNQMGFTTAHLPDIDDPFDYKANVTNVVTKIDTESQVIGENAKFAINGTYYTSTSNTITSNVSRIKGLTIDLKGVSEGETTITVERDKETVANAVSDIVDAYNELVKNVDNEIAKGGDLDDQFTLRLLRNQIRNMMTGSIITPGVYKNLDSIGITVEKASANNIETANVDMLYFDKEKFLKAFDADRDSLKGLLIGVNETDKGLFGNLDQTLDQALTYSSGYFQTAEKSYNNQISKLTNQIKKAETAAERYRERLEAKFASMDLLISKIQNQYSSFLTG